MRWIEDLYWRWVICGCFKHEWEGTVMTRTEQDGKQYQTMKCAKCGKLEG